MYAIFQTGGKQYKVSQGDIIDIELIEEKSKVSFKDVKLFCDGVKTEVGAPVVKNCVIHGEVLEQVQGPKVFALKYRRRKMSRTKVGHRQQYSRVKILEIMKG